MKPRVALGREPGGVVGYLVRDGDVHGPERAVTEAEVLSVFGAVDVPVVRVGEGPATGLPAKITPEEERRIPALEQQNPPDVISAWVRIWAMGLRMKARKWDGVICALQGDLTHWLHVSADEIVSAQSSVTPRLAGALGVDAAALDVEGVADALSRPERLASMLRVAEVRGEAGQALGALIGAELAAMRAYWLGQEIKVIGEGALAKAYAGALEAQGVPCELSTPEVWVVPGLLSLLG